MPAVRPVAAPCYEGAVLYRLRAQVSRATGVLVAVVFVVAGIGATAATPLVSSRGYVFVFCALIIIPLIVVSRDLRSGRRYRLGWLIAAMLVTALLGVANMFGFASVVLEVTGERVRAAVVEVRTTDENDVVQYQCVLEAPDGHRVPGELVVENACHEEEDVFVEPSGLVDPVRVEDRVDGSVGLELTALLLAMALCVLAGRPRVPDTADLAPRRRTHGSRRSRSRKRRLRPRLRQRSGRK